MSIDLTTKYGSLTLVSPVVVGACPLTAENLVRLSMMTAGAGAIVLPSLFDEQVVLWKAQTGRVLSKNEQNSLRRAERIQATSVSTSAANFLTMTKNAAEQLSIPVIASLNGDATCDWLEFAAELQNAGASAVEWSVGPSAPGNWADSRALEDAIVETATKISNAIQIPLFLKLTRGYTSVSHLARRLQTCCDGLVLFGHAPEVDINLDNLQTTSRWGLTKPGSILTSLDSIMQVHAFCPELSLTANGGIGDSSDLIKSLLSGADAAMVTSAIYRDSTDAIRMLLDGLLVFMEHHHMQSMQDFHASRPAMHDPDDDRIDYITALSSSIECSKDRVADHIVYSDRWGHPQSPR